MTKPVVYFIRNERTRAVKIGYAADLRARFSGIKTSASDPLTLVGAIPGGPDVEAKLHERFRHLGVQGEWFRDDPELAAAVDLLSGLYDLTEMIEAQLPEHQRESTRAIHWFRSLVEMTGLNDYEVAQMCRLSEGRVRGIRNGKYKNLVLAETLRILAAYLMAIEAEINRVQRLGEPSHALWARAESLKAAGRSILRDVDRERLHHLFGRELSDVEVAVGYVRPALREDREGYAEASGEQSEPSARDRDWLFVQSGKAGVPAS